MKEIKVKVEEFEILQETYFIYIYEKKNMTEFYIGKKDCGIIKFMIGLDLNKIGISVDDFIYNKLIEWIYNYNLDMEE